MTFYDPRFPIHVPSTSPASLGVGLNALSDDTTGASNIAVGLGALQIVTTGANNIGVGVNAGSAITTGSNNIEILTGAATDPATAATANTLVISGGATAVMSATSINSTPAVTIPGTLAVTGATTLTGAINKVTITAPATSATLTIADGKTLTANNTLTLAGTDSTTMTFPSATGTIVSRTSTDTLTNKTLTDVIDTDTKVVSGNSVFGSNSGLSNLLGISIPLTAGGKYALMGQFPMSSSSTGGVQFALNTSDTLTLTDVNMTAKLLPTNGSAQLINTTTSALGTALGSGGAYTLAELVGALTVNVAGTLTVQAAQNSSYGTSTTIFQNGFVQVTRTV